VSAVNATAFAVTPTLRESYAEGDTTKLAASGALERRCVAALLAAEIVPASYPLPPRRAVLAPSRDYKCRPEHGQRRRQARRALAIDRVGRSPYVDNSAPSRLSHLRSRVHRRPLHLGDEERT